MTTSASRRRLVHLAFALVFAACQPREDAPAPSLLHLADLLDQAEVVSAGPPESAREERRWDFDGVHPDWRAVSSKDSPSLADVELEGAEDAMRVSLLPPTADQFPFRTGGVAVDLGELRFEDWDTVLVRARSLGRFAGIVLATNLDEEGALPRSREFFASPEVVPVFNDGSVQTYAIPLRPRRHAAPENLRSLAILFGAPNAAGIEVRSVALVPRGSAFLEDAGARPVTREGTTRHTLFAHAPARLTYPVEVSAAARLDFGLAVSSGDEVTYRVRAAHDGREDAPRLLLYDLEADPFALKAVNDEHPDVVRRYHRELLEHWQAHQTLATQFQDSDAAAMTPEQLQQLQALGYIQ